MAGLRARVDRETTMLRSLPVLLALIVAAVTAADSPARDSAVRVVQRGQTVRVAVTPGGTPGCLFAVTYSNQTTVNWPLKTAVLGKVSWSARIPRNAPLGLAHWNVRCGPTWEQHGSWRIVAAPLPAPNVAITKAGFSQLPDLPATGSVVSYGVLPQYQTG
jgi:hypothetical protein